MVFHRFLADGTYDGYSVGQITAPPGGTIVQGDQIPNGVDTSTVKHVGSGDIEYVDNQSQIEAALQTNNVLMQMALIAIASRTVMGAMARVLVTLADGNVGAGEDQLIIDQFKGQYLTGGFGDETAAEIGSGFIANPLFTVATVFANLPQASTKSTINGTIIP